MSPESLFWWSCASAPLVALAVSQLSERGLIDIDSPIKHYVPEVVIGPAGNVTLKHILTHTSGLEAASDIENESDRTFEVRLIDNWVPGLRARYDPGVPWMVLKRVFKAVAGRELNTYLSGELCPQLRMSNTHIELTAKEVSDSADRLAVLHSNESDHDTLMSNLRINGGIGLWGTMRDLVRPFEILLGAFHGRSPSSSPFKDRHTAENIVSIHRSGLLDERLGVRSNWGLGLPVDGRVFGGGSWPRNTFGYYGLGGSTIVVADPSCGAVAAIAFNKRPDNKYRELQRTYGFLTAVRRDFASLS